MSAPNLPLLSLQEAREVGETVGIPELKAGLSLYRVLLQHPLLAKRINDLMEALSTESGFDARLRELTIMRIGWLNNGVYEWSLHWLIASQLGVAERDLSAVRDWEKHDHWSPADRAALRATDEVIANGRMTKESWEELAKHLLSPQDRLELVTVILSWKMISDLLQNLEVPLDDGFAPWPPEGESPSGVFH